MEHPAPESIASPAGLWVRLAALVYDSLLLIACCAVVGAVLIPLGTPADAARSHTLTVVPDWYRHLVLMPALLLTIFCFYGYFWAQSGQTLGMQTWRLQLSLANGGRAGWGDSAKRFGAALLFPALCGGLAMLWGSGEAAMPALLLGFLGNYLWMYGNTARLAWHDQLSRTRVLRLPPQAKGKRKTLELFSRND